MQFTGLHDKNGKEIYEGDILKWGVHTLGVYWDRDSFVGKALYEHNDRGFYDYGLCPLVSESEIIGNNFESRELFSVPPPEGTTNVDQERTKGAKSGE